MFSDAVIPSDVAVSPATAGSNRSTLRSQDVGHGALDEVGQPRGPQRREHAVEPVGHLLVPLHE